MEVSVLLINPPIPIKLSTPQEKGPFSDIGENLGLELLAGSLTKNKISNTVIDCCLENIDVGAIDYSSIDIVGISVPSIAAVKETLAISTAIKKNKSKIHITVGGHFASIAPKLFLNKEQKAIDSVIIDDGEETIVELYNALRANSSWKVIRGIAYFEDFIIKTPYRKVNEILDDIPIPTHTKLKMVLEKGGYASIYTSKGCYGKCIFCSAAGYKSAVGNKKWRYRTAENVLKEIKELKATYEINSLIIIDDCFLGINGLGLDRAKEIGESIIKDKVDVKFLIMCKPEEVEIETMKILRKAGLVAVSIGIESGDSNVLKRFCKESTIEDIKKAVSVLKNLDIEIFIGLIPFDPYSSLIEIKNTINFLYELSILSIALFRKRMVIMPKTVIEQELLVKQQLLSKGTYIIQDPKAEKFAQIMERSLLKYGSLINNLFYVKKWEKAISQNKLEYNDKRAKLKKAEVLLNYESFNILNYVMAKVEDEIVPVDFTSTIENKCLKLYRKILTIIN